MFKILNGYENIDSNIFFEIKESKITRGHNYTLIGVRDGGQGGGRGGRCPPNSGSLST